MMNNSALSYEDPPQQLQQRHIGTGTQAVKNQTDSKSDTDTFKQQQQTVMLKNKLILLNKEHEELYRQFAKAHTETEMAKIRLSIYEQALKQILSTTDLEKVRLIADTKSAQQRDHTIAMHNWAGLL